jgi:tetratricopeptide (TPR) repeat protein
MIAASVDTKDFSQVLPQERFSVDAPVTNPPMAASSLDITRTESGMDFSIVEKTEGPETRPVERLLQEVVDRCKRDLEIHPNNPRTMFNLALASINAGDSDAGVEMLQEVLRIEPRNYTALASLGLLFFNRGDLRSAEEAYLRVHSAYPKDPAALINLASIALRNDDFINAAEYLEKAAALDGCSVMAKHLLAMILLRLGKHNRAIGMLRTTLRESGPSAELSQGLAIAYLAAGDFRKAERAFLTCLAVNKNMASAVHGLALLRLQRGQWNGAAEILLEHLDRLPEDFQARELLAQAFVGLGDFARARGQLLALVSPERPAPENRTRLASICNNLGFCFAKEGKVREAELWLRRSLLLNGEAAAAPYSNLGRVLLAQGRLEEALSIVAKPEELGLSNSDTKLLKAVILVELQRPEEAIDVLQTLVNTGTAPTGAYSDLGSLLAEWREDYDAAVNVLREGLRRDPENVLLLNNLSYVYLMRGEPTMARAVLDRIENDSANPIMLSATRGLLSLWEGDIKGGDQLYRKAESMAFQSGQRNLGVSVRQKRCLEVARALLRDGHIEDANKQLQLGVKAEGGMRFYRFQEQLLALRERFRLEAGG